MRRHCQPIPPAGLPGDTSDQSLWSDQAAGAGRNLASSLNIAAFNLGNAMGAWVGGLVIDHGPGLRALGAAGAVLTLAGLGLALWSRRLERRDAAAAGAPAQT